jgi:putative Holliday junction resolvase
MERILGLDVGDKRVGVALSDPSGRYTSSLPTLLRAGGKAEDEILRLIELHGVKIVVVGLPLGAGGEKNEQCLKIENFCRRLLKRALVAVVYVDEHLTSEEAKERLQAMGRRDFSKGDVDAMSASLILQSYLDQNKTGA